LDELLTEAQAASLLGVTREALGQRRKRGTVQPARCVHPILYNREDILKLKAEREQRARERV
jgi:hypothetical protein